MATRVILGWLVLCPFGVVNAARGDASPDKAKADALFNSAKVLMANGNFTAACTELSESESLDPQVGTALNLAYCYENLGRTATAWSVWLQAAAAAAAKGDPEREAFATGRASLLQPQLLRVTVTVAPQPARDTMELSIDHTPLARNEWGLPFPLDPGEYELRATAEGFRPWFWRFMVAKGRVPTILVPELDPWPPTPSAAPEAMKSDRDGAGLMPVVWGAGGIGLAALGVGAAFGVSALVNNHASYEGRNCVRDVCNGTGASYRSQAQSDAMVADVTLASGAVMVVASALIYVAVHPATTAAPRLGWTAGLSWTPSGGGTGFVAREW